MLELGYNAAQRAVQVCNRARYFWSRCKARVQVAAAGRNRRLLRHAQRLEIGAKNRGYVRAGLACRILAVDLVDQRLYMEIVELFGVSILVEMAMSNWPRSRMGA